MEHNTSHDFFVSACYEVLDERVSKYTSTDVYGSPSISGGGTSISSSTSYHQDQEIWVKNVETEKESKLNFKTFNIDVRPGHKLLLITNRNTGKVERAINLTTDQVFVGNGDVNNKEVSQTSMSANIIVSLLYAFLISLPFASFIFILAWWKDRPTQFDLKKYLYPILAILASYLYWSYKMFTGDDGGPSSEFFQSFIAYLLTLTFPAFLISLKVFEDQGEDIRSKVSSLKDYQDSQVAFCKKTYL
ncbi:hypothetical protein A3740_18880 [Oleiphilus sp. HI0068]|uniref:hypothetical protein n=1 Tax=Oleiphilus sp. HI0132 TaxID=1822270 RepID=UPI0007C2EF55|nr:hypothetical protein [Oleiphilus sp. HI0132]KZY73509.1 hypothetical protein A3740_18880 [Oleiphilus sp. HI0068]KZY81207.1 hypothetical protein A3741_17600 [Oleiphilus sp. HI0069]KZZ31775.1 hypothetical protein A3755_11115 [Oleiphilus sp. HI0085]KZZ76108.1 hypothetical protein A3766_14915 [Oleiphilus sp. HI0132]